MSKQALRAVALVAPAVFAGAVAAAATASPYAPVDQPGPALTIPAKQLAASLSCTDDVRTADRQPVLLTPATTVTSRENFGFNWIPALRARGFPVCTSDLPGEAGQNMEDMQTRAEYVVYAIRKVHELSGRRIAVVGHSQGGMIMRWPLRFWPDTRAMVEDVVGMAATNHGSAIVPLICATGCAPALWQQRDTSAWTAALNSGQETFAGIDYTAIYSHTDEFVQPNMDDTGTRRCTARAGSRTSHCRTCARPASPTTCSSAPSTRSPGRWASMRSPGTARPTPRASTPACARSRSCRGSTRRPEPGRSPRR